MSWEDAAPGEREAGERSWRVVRSAYEERIPSPRPRPRWPVVALVAALAIVAAVLSPPGMAVLGKVRDAVREPNARPAVFSLPTAGRLLVESDKGVWVVQRDGSKRLLGGYHDASWSPNGRFLAAVHGAELRAIEPDGTIHWTLGRRGGPRVPTWSDASPPCCRIAYRAGTAVRVINGDGTDDRAWQVREAPVTPAWRPGTHELATVGANGTLALGDVDRDVPRLSFPVPMPFELLWTGDGRRLLVVGGSSIGTYSPRGRLLRPLPFGGVAAAVAPRDHRLAVVRALAGGRSEVRLVDTDRGTSRILFSGVGEFGDAAWSPDGRWLVLAWDSADQWLFLRTAQPRRVIAVAHIAASFGGHPRIAGWCCP